MTKRKTTKRAITVGKNPPGAGFRTERTIPKHGRVIVITAPDGHSLEVYRIDPLTSIEMYAGTFATAQTEHPALTRVLTEHVRAEHDAKRETRDADLFEAAGRATTIHFDGSPSWPALAIVGEWNGFAVPIVTPATREKIAAYLDANDEGDAAAELRAVKPIAPGRIRLHGWAFSEGHGAPSAPSAPSAPVRSKPRAAQYEIRQTTHPGSSSPLLEVFDASGEYLGTWEAEGVFRKPKRGGRPELRKALRMYVQRELPELAERWQEAAKDLASQRRLR